MARHLLLIDDDEDESDFFSLVLKELPPVKYSYADSARKGIELMKADLPDIVLLDMNMPAVNGLDCLREIKGSAALKSVPIIIYSNSNDENLRQSALAIGAADCLKKPQSMGHLKELLQKVLSDFEN